MSLDQMSHTMVKLLEDKPNLDKLHCFKEHPSGLETSTAKWFECLWRVMREDQGKDSNNSAYFSEGFIFF